MTTPILPMISSRYVRLLAVVVLKLRSLEFRARGWLVSVYIRVLGGKCGRNLQIGRRVYFKHPPHSGVVLGSDVKIGNDVTLDVEPGATLTVGQGVKITGYCYIGSSGTTSIGKNTLIAEFVSIRDSNHGIARDKLIVDQALSVGVVEIGADVWLGRGSAIIKGACIEVGAVIGANSVVRSRVPKGDVVAGVPARRIGSRSGCE